MAAPKQRPRARSACHPLLGTSSHRRHLQEQRRPPLGPPLHTAPSLGGDGDRCGVVAGAGRSGRQPLLRGFKRPPPQEYHRRDNLSIFTEDASQQRSPCSPRLFQVSLCVTGSPSCGSSGRKIRQRLDRSMNMVQADDSGGSGRSSSTSSSATPSTGSEELAADGWDAPWRLQAAATLQEELPKVHHQEV